MSKKDKEVPKSTRPTKEPPNGWAFLINLTNKLYGLLKVNNFLAAAILCICLVLVILVIKYPSDDLPKIAGGMGAFLTSEKYYLFPLTFVLLISIAGNFYQRRVYKLEIDRLCIERSEKCMA